MALTDEGAAFHARCVRILAEIDEAETEVTRGRDKAVGLLKITSTFAFGRRQLATLVHEFQKGHPDLQIHLEASDSIVSLVDGGFDLAIRFGPLVESSLIARVLAPDHRVICGAPTYLELARLAMLAFGKPVGPDLFAYAPICPEVGAATPPMGYRWSGAIALAGCRGLRGTKKTELIESN